MRIRLSVVVVSSLAAGWCSVATAQSYPPAPPGYYYPPPYPPPRFYNDAQVPPVGVGSAGGGAGPYQPAPYAYGHNGYGWTAYPPNAYSAPARPYSAPSYNGSGLPAQDRPGVGTAQELPPQFRRQLVDYVTSEPAGTIIIDTPHTYLYLVLGAGKALRYGIGVGREGFTWSGTERISRMSEWPDWYPPKEMIERQPYLPRFIAGGDSNPLGARALYLGNTLYRIHGTNQPFTIGHFTSSGCIRLTNADIEDLYNRVNVGTRVVVLPGSPAMSAAAQERLAR